MKVETIQQQNEILAGCGCCQLPTCQSPFVDVQVRNLEKVFDPPVDQAEALTQLAAEDWDTADWQNIYSWYTINYFARPRSLSYAASNGVAKDSLGDVYLASGTQFRYRIRIPSTHTRSYFKAVWSEFQIEFTGSYPGDLNDASAYVTPVAEVSKEYVWTGPGDQSEPLGSSWVSDWSDPITIPSGVAGCAGLVNMEWKCYRSAAIGVKPSGYFDDQPPAIFPYPGYPDFVP